ncbi:flagellin [Litorisediminicola beolgyonensis]|uniref:Flagellin n=1 Tax=Litorisediminicola beolgyonensis TaxID=1173614 RepID=A0ABW3ZHL2_9RHOB
MMISIGDMAQSFLARAHQGRLKMQVSELGLALTTGRVTDRAAHLRGDSASAHSLSLQLSRLDGFRVTGSEAKLLATGMQTALGRVQELQQDLAPLLLQANLLVTPELRQTLADQSANALSDMIGALNTTAGGQYLFGGAATERAPLQNATSLIDDLVAAIGPSPELTSVQDALDQWFDLPAGGFETQTYLGAADGRSDFSIASGKVASLSIRADDPAIRDGLKGLAKAVLASDTRIGLSARDQTDLLKDAGTTLTATQSQLSVLRASVGVQENRIEAAATLVASESRALNIALSRLVGADPYETASELEASQVQLETLYTVTLRASQLSLVNFLK